MKYFDLIEALIPKLKETGNREGNWDPEILFISHKAGGSFEVQDVLSITLGEESGVSTIYVNCHNINLELTEP